LGNGQILPAPGTSAIVTPDIALQHLLPKGSTMGLSATHILILLVIAAVLFSKGKISEVMGDVAKGIKSFKKGMADEDDVAKPIPPRTIDNEASNSNDRSKTG
jgi:sec-independent protein translocase protein TatA